MNLIIIAIIASSLFLMLILYLSFKDFSSEKKEEEHHSSPLIIIRDGIDFWYIEFLQATLSKNVEKMKQYGSESLVKKALESRLHINVPNVVLQKDLEEIGDSIQVKIISELMDGTKIDDIVLIDKSTLKIISIGELGK